MKSSKHMTLSLTAISLTMLSLSVQAKPASQTCEPVTEAQVASLFDRWNDSLKTLDPAKVTANYSGDAVLLPTVSNKPRTNHAEIQDYFVHFLEKKPQGTINSRTIKLGCNTATDMGVYTFKLKDGNATKEVQARYTYQYSFENGKWVIEHHHSSAMPEKIAQH